MASCEEQFLIEYFKEMRAEIVLRIGDHRKLVATKIISCGALLGFLLTETLQQPFCTWGFTLIPIISMLYDVMIAKNIKCIHRIATWIKFEIEIKLSPDYYNSLWEHLYGQSDKEAKEDKDSRNYGKTDILFLSIFTTATIIVPITLLYINNNKYLPFVCIFLFSLQVFVIVLMSKWILWIKSTRK